MADRRAGKGPYVRAKHHGQKPRARNENGEWRRKRNDAGKKRK